MIADRLNLYFVTRLPWSWVRVAARRPFFWARNLIVQ